MPAASITNQWGSLASLGACQRPSIATPFLDASIQKPKPLQPFNLSPVGLLGGLKICRCAPLCLERQNSFWTLLTSPALISFPAMSGVVILGDLLGFAGDFAAIQAKGRQLLDTLEEAISSASVKSAQSSLLSLRVQVSLSLSMFEQILELFKDSPGLLSSAGFDQFSKLLGMASELFDGTLKSLNKMKFASKPKVSLMWSFKEREIDGIHESLRRLNNDITLFASLVPRRIHNVHRCSNKLTGSSPLRSLKRKIVP